MIRSVVDPIDIINLPDFDLDVTLLYEKLSQSADKVFADNQRLIICHHDTDYYPSMSTCGNTIYNLITIIAYLDISSDHTVILANDYSGLLQKNVDKLCAIHNINTIRVIPFSLWYDYPVVNNRPFTKRYPPRHLYSFLAGVPRSHKQTMLCALAENNLLNKGMISFQPSHPHLSKKTFQPNNRYKENVLPNINLRTTIPHTSRNNENLNVSQKSKLLHIKYHKLLQSTIVHQEIEGTPVGSHTLQQQDFLQKALIFLTTESVGNYPQIFYTEKTWKSFSNSCALMLLASKGSIKNLNNLGFETFHSVWDESYDTKVDCLNRAQLICQQLMDLSKYYFDDLAHQCMPIFEHNYYHLQTFADKQLNALREQL
jgi:hypothetical protein